MACEFAQKFLKESDFIKFKTYAINSLELHSDEDGLGLARQFYAIDYLISFKRSHKEISKSAIYQLIRAVQHYCIDGSIDISGFQNNNVRSYIELRKF